MREEVLADNVRLFLGDCREVIPTLKGVDALVSDPPYGIQDLVGGYGRGLSGNDKYIANDKNLNVVSEALVLARKTLAKNSWVAAFYSCRITPTFFKMMEVAGYREADYFGEVMWDKRAPGLGTQIRYQHENVAFFKMGKPVDLTDCMSVINFAALRGDARTEGSSHPHEKPHQVMLNIVGTVPGKLVLDPFMGTGSTGAAAVQLRRGFIGIELDSKHFEVALKKVSAAIKQPVAFWE